DQVQVAVPVEIGETGRRPSVGFNRLIPSHQFDGVFVNGLFSRAIVADEIDEAVEGAVGPAAAGVVGIVPFVIAPIVSADYQVQFAIAIEIDVAPEIASNRPRSEEHTS